MVINKVSLLILEPIFLSQVDTIGSPVFLIHIYQRIKVTHVTVFFVRYYYTTVSGGIVLIQLLINHKLLTDTLVMSGISITFVSEIISFIRL